LTAIIQRTKPSYKAGCAKSAGESAYPQLWRGLRTAWVPALGNTGTTVRDLGPNKRDLTIALANNVWTADFLDSTAAEDAATFTALPAMTSWTVVSFCEQLDNSAIGYGLFGMDADTRNLIGWRPAIGYQQIVLNNYSSVLYDWGVEADVLRGRQESWSWRFTDNTASRMGRGAEFNDGSVPSSTFLWTSVDRLFERNTAYGSRVKWKTILVYNRWLSDGELLILNADPLAPFRRRLYFPTSEQAAAGGSTSPWHYYTQQAL